MKARLTLTLTVLGLAAPAAASAQTTLAPERVAEQVLALERQKAHAPADPALEERLGQLAATHQLARPEEGLAFELTSVLDANRWLAMASAGLGVLAVWLGIWAFGRRARGRLVPAAAVLALGVGAGAARVQAGALDRAVVMAPDAAARVSPVPEGDVRFVPRAGDVLRIEAARGDWRRVRHPGGQVAWMPASALAPVGG